MSKNTALELEYVDASNYKQSTTVVLVGEITQEQIATIRKHLHDHCLLIANQVGLPSPSEQFREDYIFPTDDDHVWTTLKDFEDEDPIAEGMHTDDEPTLQMSIEKLTSLIARVSWDEAREMERTGMSELLFDSADFSYG